MKILASFDDACIEDLYVAELMEKYKIPAIFYFPVYPELCNERKGRQSLTLEEQQQIADKFEIGSHTLTHPLLTRIKPGIARTEITNSRLMLQDRFKQDITSFAYPRGYSNPELQVMVQEAGYTNARSTVVGYIHPSENSFFTQTTVHVGCNRKEYGGQSWYEYALYMYGEARKIKNSVFHFFGHGWELEKNNAWDEFEMLLQVIKI